jgi:hypothetical protein
VVPPAGFADGQNGWHSFLLQFETVEWANVVGIASIWPRSRRDWHPFHERFLPF